MEVYDKLQENYKEMISKGKINFRKSPKDRITIPYVETRLEALENQWQSFCDTHRQIITEISKQDLEKSSYYTNSIYDVTETLYFEYKTELKDVLNKLQGKVKSSLEFSNLSSVDDACKYSVKLPEISIPRFSGKYTEWPSFRDLFTSLIHNNVKLDEVQKLHYLKSHLSGEAEHLLRYIPITAKNYIVCWTQLTSRYDNKKYLSNNILRRFMSQKTLHHESSIAIKELLDNMNECLSALQNIDIDISNWDIIVIYIMTQKLDPESRKQWESKANESEGLPTLSAFKEFLEHKFRSLEFLDAMPKSKPPNVNKIVNVSQVESLNHFTSNNTNFNCQYCKANHKLINCKDFAKADYDTRHNFIQTSRLCFNCFGANHSVFSCRQTTRCRVCKRKHHSLLHPKNIEQGREKVESKDNGVVVSSATTSQSGVESVVSCFSNIHSQVLLATAIVEVESKTGSAGLIFRCLLDQGSQASLITESAVQALGLKKIPNKVYISGVGSRHESLASKYVVEIKLKSIHNPQFTLVVKAHVLTKLTSFLPSKKVDVQLWPELTKLKLADPKFDVPNKIDLLLGAEVYGQILVEGVIKGPPGFPVAQNTHLGWILSGQIHTDRPDLEPYRANSTIISMHVQYDEKDLLKRFWELESDDLSARKKIFTEEEQKCEEIFTNTVTRDDCGRYVVTLPFRDANPICKKGNFKDIAIKRLCQLEKRLSKNPKFKEQYAQVIGEYLQLNHMELVPEEQRDKTEVVYLPHHAIVRDDKVTSKIRVVFDASCSGTNGVSLNDDLLVGPPLQDTLRHIVMRWRKHPICLVADIVKMYRQIKVKLEDADDFQRILWRDGSGTIQHYRMLRVTFGTASAPYLAVRVLQQVAYDEGKNHPAAVEKILHDFYMDDLMTGCQTVEECLKIKREISYILEKGGFVLQKWISNNKEFMKEIGRRGEEEEARLEIRMEKETNAIQKVLGLTWNSSTDEFEYNVRLPPLESPITKRKVISDISRLFDPLGWIAPIIIISKIFIQKLWLSGIDWDQELPPHLLQEWLTYRSDLAKLSNFRIPRWMHTNAEDKAVELHGFSDASNDAYAAVIYVRIVDKNYGVHVNLVTSKTKVSPIKQVSIPRLELCGAHLLAKLIMEVSEVLEIEKAKIHAWTDSSVVLAWLSSHPSKWKTFVANRVADILTVLDRTQWAHVKSRDNPADCASRGVKDYNNLDLWKQGPSWLRELKINYSPQEECQDTKLEERSKKVCYTVDSIDLDENLFTRYSSLRKLVRAVVYLRRYIMWLGCRSTVFPAYLTNKELREALSKCIVFFQKMFLGSDVESISKTGAVAKKSKLASLNPYLDEEGLLRVGGRLQNAELNDSMKHPILIPRNSHLAKLIVAEAHERTLHGGPQLMLNFIRSKYWIVDGKNLVKMYVRKCITCIRHASSFNQPLMGQLPASRVTAGRPFRQTGVDYAGPIAIRTTKGRGHRSMKGYICLFICMATKAIHLEVVSDLTSEGFLAAFKRMVARRGHVSDLWSDNGTNFLGAEKELKNLLNEEKSSVAVEIASWLSSNGTTWHRIPPYTPNFGGLWEAGIKSTKHHLKRVIGNSTLTFEEMSTLLSQIEACLNSRPLTSLSDNAQDPHPLTPGHFLVGEPLVLLPDVNYEKSTLSSLRRWQLIQRMTQDFWRRWSNEYLTQFMHRYRWNRHSPEPKVGDVVLVKEDNLPPARWLYGIIIDKHTGSDNVTRVVSLRCKGNVIKRPVSKLRVLPINED